MTPRGSGLRNRPISTFVAAFAALSLVASVLPLLTRGGADQSLFPGLERGTSFSVYCAFLLLFVFFFLPRAFRRESGRTLGPWWAVAGFALLFAAVPGVVSAYISGVAGPQALFVGGLVASACAAVILVRAAFGPAAVAITFAIGCLTLFVIPAIEAFCWSTGTATRVPLASLSLAGWLRRMAWLREPVDPAVIVAAAAALWIAVVVVAVRAGRGVRAAALCVLAVPALVAPGRTAPQVSINPLLGIVARPGARIPVSIVARGGGEAEIVFKTEALRIPADDQPRVALITLVASESEAEARRSGESVRVPLPFRWVDPARPVVAILAGGAGAEAIRAALPGAEVVAIDLGRAPPVPGALELFDAIVAEAEQWNALPGGHRALLEGYASLSGQVAIVGPGEPDTRESGANVRTVASAASLGTLELRRRIGPDPFDATLKSLFARPDWQALDLTGLVLFLLIYHGAFLVAFLLPLLLDSHKSTPVYLVSVGTVMVVVVVVAWWSLKQFFLRDNQVYTQSLTYVAVGSRDSVAVARQFRCYASMSGERSDVPWPLERDLVDYRDAGPPARVLDLGRARRLDDVWLDRFQAKLLVREDLTLRPPVVLAAEDGGFRVRPVPDVPDPLGLRASSLTAAVVLESDGGLRKATIQGRTITIGERLDGGLAAALDPIARAVHGRFRRPGGGRVVLVRATGLNRLDDTSGFFKTADLDAVLAFDV